jgi:hypothetical protein
VFGIVRKGGKAKELDNERRKKEANKRTEGGISEKTVTKNKNHEDGE